MGKAVQSQVVEIDGALAVIIPEELLTASKFSLGDTVNLYSRNGRIEITDPAEPHYDIEEMVASITDEQIHGEIDWGPPVGREVW